MSSPAAPSSCTSRSRPTLSAEPMRAGAAAGRRHRATQARGARRSYLLRARGRWRPCARLSPPQRVLGSVNQRSAEPWAACAAALDRFAAIGGCMVAVEKGLLADSLDLCLRRVGAIMGAWVPNEADDIAQWLARPIRSVTTDRPDLALERVRRSAVEMAGDQAALDLRRAPALAGAARHGVRAARMEMAAARRVERARHFAGQRHVVAPLVGMAGQGRGEQRLGVGMLRRRGRWPAPRRFRRSCRDTSPRSRGSCAPRRRGRGR